MICFETYSEVRTLPSKAQFLLLFLGLGLLTSFTLRVVAAEKSAGQWLDDARAVFDRGETNQALALAGKAIDAEPKNPQGFYVRGRMRDTFAQYEKAVADYDEVLKLNRNAKQLYQLRGLANFKLGRIQESIADFDRFVQLEPSQAAHHWQRGISYYYAGRYSDGRKQFELHQTVNSNDVENAVWHFLCVARSDNFQKARASLIPIQRDSRPPMMEIYALFAGKGSEETVLAAARAGEPAANELKQHLFYAHLYLGLYHEALGNDNLAKEHLVKASDEFGMDHYMGDVARVHVKLRWESWLKR